MFLTSCLVTLFFSCYFFLAFSASRWSLSWILTGSRLEPGLMVELWPSYWKVTVLDVGVLWSVNIPLLGVETAPYWRKCLSRLVMWLSFSVIGMSISFPSILVSFIFWSSFFKFSCYYCSNFRSKTSIVSLFAEFSIVEAWTENFLLLLFLSEDLPYLRVGAISFLAASTSFSSASLSIPSDY